MQSIAIFTFLVSSAVAGSAPYGVSTTLKEDETGKPRESKPMFDMTENEKL